MTVWFEWTPPQKNSTQSRTPTQFQVDAFAFRNSSPDSKFLFWLSFEDHTLRQFGGVKTDSNSDRPIE
jgi:hypothetical protein